MISRFQKKYSVWLDVSLPKRAEVESLAVEFEIDQTIEVDLLNPTPKQEVSVHGDKLYAVIHIPVFKHSHTTRSSFDNEQEIDFVIGRKVLITVRYDSVDAIYKYSKEAEVKEMLEREEGGDHTFSEIMRAIYHSLFDELSFMEDQLREIEKKIFSGREKEMVFSISKMSRDLLSFRRIIEPHGNLLDELKESGVEILGRKFSTEVDSLLEEWQRLERAAANHAAFADELRETNNSLLSTKQNEIMKILTIMAFVTFPLSLIASVFGMNTSWLPVVGLPHDFWLVMGIMGIAAAIMFVFFKKKKWL